MDILKTLFIIMIMSVVSGFIIHLITNKIRKKKLLGGGEKELVIILLCYFLTPLLIMTSFCGIALTSETTTVETNMYNIVCNEENNYFSKDPLGGTVITYIENGEEVKHTLNTNSNFEISSDGNNYVIVEELQYTNKFYNFVFGPIVKYTFSLTKDNLALILVS